MDDLSLDPFKTKTFWGLISAGISVGLVGWWVGKEGTPEPIYVFFASFMLYISASYFHALWVLSKNNHLHQIETKYEDDGLAKDTMETKFTISNVKPADIEFIKRNASVLFVDDQDQSAVELLRSSGFFVVKLDDIDKSTEDEITKDLKYDLVFLDIQGVGSSYPEKSGLGILKSVKSKGVFPYVVSYSSKSYSLGSIESRELEQNSDDIANKQRPESYEKIATKWLLKSFSIDGILEEVASHIEGSSFDDLKQETANMNPTEFEHFVKSKLNHLNPSRLNLLIRRIRIIIALQN